jgi:predicted RNA-binding Zn-ribbon protein involved in translation (DUF1610 family)
MRRLTTISNSIDAALLRHRLEMEGIESFATNEHTSNMLPHFYGLLGHGIQIMVREADYERAKDILLESENEKVIRKCPNCGSRNIGFGVQGKRRLGDRLLILLSAIAGVPMGNIRNKYFCKNCNEHFT